MFHPEPISWALAEERVHTEYIKKPELGFSFLKVDVYGNRTFLEKQGNRQGVVFFLIVSVLGHSVMQSLT